MSATATITHASIGRGNTSSLPCRRVSTDRLSIVDRLADRSVTGRVYRYSSMSIMVIVYISNGVAAAAVGTRRGLWRDDSICRAKLKRSVQNYVAEG